MIYLIFFQTCLDSLLMTSKYFIGGSFYLLETGIMRRCPKGFGVFDTTECKEACEKLDIPLSGQPFKDGKPCYKGGRNVCNQNGRFTRKSSMICKEAGTFT